MGETIKTDVKYKSYFWVKWEVQEQDTASNKSTIAWSCGLSPGEQYYTNAIRMSAVTIDGVEVYAGGTYSLRHYGLQGPHLRLRHPGGGA